MRKFKVGDKVKIRESILADLGEEYKHYTRIYTIKEVIPNMEKLYSGDKTYPYRLKEDTSYNWGDHELEKALTTNIIGGEIL